MQEIVIHIKINFELFMMFLEWAREKGNITHSLFSLCVLNAKAHTQFQTAAEKKRQKGHGELWFKKYVCVYWFMSPHNLINIQFVIYLSGEDFFLPCTSCVSLMVCRKIHRKTFSLSCHKCPYLFDIKAIIIRVEGKKNQFHCCNCRAI